MRPTRCEIRQWLKDIGKNRQWLATQCGVSLGTVNNWLAENGVDLSARAKLLVHNLMYGEQATTVTTHNIHLPLTEQEWALVCDAMKGPRFLQFINTVLKQAKQQQKPSIPASDSPTNSFGTGIQVGAFMQALQHAHVESHKPHDISLSFHARIQGAIAAGSVNYDFDDCYPAPVKIPRALKSDEYLLQVNGQSMEPMIPDGSVIVMRQFNEFFLPSQGSIVEYRDDEGVTLKRLNKKSNVTTDEQPYCLEPLNPQYPDIEPSEYGRITGIFVEILPHWQNA